MKQRLWKRTALTAVAVAATAGIVLLAVRLTEGEPEENAMTDMALQTETVAEVDTMVLRRQTFHQQLLCNGKLVAIRRAELMCPQSGTTVQRVLVSNGQWVEEGSVLAVADSRSQQADLEKARKELERATVDLSDKLIGLGYDADKGLVPAEIRHRAEVTSGYDAARFAVKTAERALADCSLKAPFSGRIADLEARAYQRGEKFATLIDDSFFDVDFQILEAELPAVRVGQRVRVTPFVDASLTMEGSVSHINPTIDAKGLIAVKARIPNRSDRLIDGMNVKVMVERDVKDMLVVPKEAVVERDGYHVVFAYQPETRRAVWTYVDILYSNLTSFAITGCERKNTTIEPGTIVITSGNLNLADDTEVKTRTPAS